MNKYCVICEKDGFCGVKKTLNDNRKPTCFESSVFMDFEEVALYEKQVFV